LKISIHYYVKNDNVGLKIFCELKKCIQHKTHWQKMKCYIIAGPNGAGKTTFAENFLQAEAGLENFFESL
jgi:ABC-type Mn2+/Zn2+ transport system ATPase subunit